MRNRMQVGRTIFIISVAVGVSCRPPSSCLNSAPQQEVMEELSYGFGIMAERDHGRACVLDVFGDVKLHTPLDFDPLYQQVFDLHREDGELRLNTLRQTHDESAGTYLMKLGQTPWAKIYFVRDLPGMVMEGAEYDLIFTATPSGDLIDHLVVGAFGNQYARYFRVLSPTRFAVSESVGREEEMGPAYQATFTISAQGKIILENSSVDFAMDGEDVADQPFCRESLLTLNTARALEKEFASEVWKGQEGTVDTLFLHNMGGRPSVVAVYTDETSTCTFYLAIPTDELREGKRYYTLYECQLPEAQWLGLYESVLRNVSVARQESEYLFHLFLQDRRPIPGGNSETGEPETETEIREIEFKWDPERGLRYER